MHCTFGSTNYASSHCLPGPSRYAALLGVLLLLGLLLAACERSEAPEPPPPPAVTPVTPDDVIVDGEPPAWEKPLALDRPAEPDDAADPEPEESAAAASEASADAEDEAPAEADAAGTASEASFDALPDALQEHAILGTGGVEELPAPEPSADTPSTDREVLSERTAGGAAPSLADQQQLMGVLQAMDALTYEPETLTQEELMEEHAADHEAQSSEQATPSSAFDGIVVDETRSPNGRSFYDVFYSEWDPPETEATYTVTVREQPGRGRGTVVMVEVNNQTTFSSRLQPRYEEVREAAEQAVQHTYQFLQHGDVSQAIY